MPVHSFCPPPPPFKESVSYKCQQADAHFRVQLERAGRQTSDMDLTGILGHNNLPFEEDAREDEYPWANNRFYPENFLIPVIIHVRQGRHWQFITLRGMGLAGLIELYSQLREFPDNFEENEEDLVSKVGEFLGCIVSRNPHPFLVWPGEMYRVFRKLNPERALLLERSLW